jgi:hypothetical protein
MFYGALNLHAPKLDTSLQHPAENPVKLDVDAIRAQAHDARL